MGRVQADTQIPPPSLSLPGCVLLLACLRDLTSQPSSASLPVICHVSYSKMRSEEGGRGGGNMGDRAGESLSHDNTIHTDGKTDTL